MKTFGKAFLVTVLVVAWLLPAAVHARQINLQPSGAAAQGPAVKYVKATLPYAVNPSRTALFIIDPQVVYSAKFTLDPKEFFTHLGEYSPLACENFGPAMDNIRCLVKECARKNIRVFLIKHAYEANGCNCGRLCDFDPLDGICNEGYCWPEVWMLWNKAVPTSQMDPRVKEITGILNADRDDYYYAEKSIYTSFTTPVASVLKCLKIDTVIVTGFMTQYCSVTTTRHGHDLGFKMIYVKDANDGPQLEQTMSIDPVKYPKGIDENDAIPFYLSIPVADVTTTTDLITRIQN